MIVGTKNIADRPNGPFRRPVRPRHAEGADQTFEVIAAVSPLGVRSAKDAYPAFAGASNPSRALRRAAKRSETSGGIAESVTGAIRDSGLCGMRFAHVRAWSIIDPLRSAPQSGQRWQRSPMSIPSCSGV